MHKGYLISLGLVIVLIAGLSAALLIPHTYLTDRMVNDSAPVLAIGACLFAAWGAWRRRSPPSD